MDADNLQYTRAQLQAKKVPELRTLLEERGLSKVGNKDTLISTFMDAQDGVEGNSEEGEELMGWNAMDATAKRPMFAWGKLCMADTDEVPDAPQDDIASVHPDYPMVIGLVYDIARIAKSMKPEEPPSPGGSLAVLVNHLSEKAYGEVVSDGSMSLFVALRVDIGKNNDASAVDADIEEVFGRNVVRPLKAVLLKGIRDLIIGFDVSGEATLFPKHFDTAETAKLRKAGYAFVRRHELEDIAITDEHIRLAMNDEDFSVERARNKTILAKILNQAKSKLRETKKTSERRASQASSLASAKELFQDIMDVPAGRAAVEKQRADRREAVERGEPDYSVGPSAKRRKPSSSVPLDDDEGDDDDESEEAGGSRSKKVQKLTGVSSKYF